MKDFSGFSKAILIYSLLCRYFFEFVGPIAAFFFVPLWVAVLITVAFILWQVGSFFIARRINVMAEFKDEEKDEDKRYA